jgi:tetratricopeptide (TPR) repeat protein
LGDYQRLAGESATALAAYEAAQAGAGEPACASEARVAAGALALQLGDPAKAASLLDGATGVVARTNHGFALLGLGRHLDALADFDSVLAADAKNDEATFGRGMCLEALGRIDEAAAAFDVLLARSPRHVSAPAARRERERLRLRMR